MQAHPPIRPPLVLTRLQLSDHNINTAGYLDSGPRPYDLLSEYQNIILEHACPRDDYCDFTSRKVEALIVSKRFSNAATRSCSLIA